MFGLQQVIGTNSCPCAASDCARQARYVYAAPQLLRAYPRGSSNSSRDRAWSIREL